MIAEAFENGALAVSVSERRLSCAEFYGLRDRAPPARPEQRLLKSGTRRSTRFLVENHFRTIITPPALWNLSGRYLSPLYWPFLWV
jgi:hypothetical protein